MRKFLIAAGAALLFAVPVSASAKELGNVPVVGRGDPGTTWVALAASPNGRVFQSEPYDSEEKARGAARSECERITGRTCRDTMSVPDNWDVVVLRCGEQNFLGASAQGVAYDNALGKAVGAGFSAGRCRQIASY